MTLLGDAAHPMTNAAGQGANTAIEDSVVLGSRVAQSGGDPVAGLRAYDGADRAHGADREPRLAADVAQPLAPTGGNSGARPADFDNDGRRKEGAGEGHGLRVLTLDSEWR